MTVWRRIAAAMGRRRDPAAREDAAAREERGGAFPFALSDAEWRRRLPPERYAVLRGRETEPACSSPLGAEEREGVYRCAGCGHALFRSAAKYDSATGWPSFHTPIPGGVFEDAANAVRYPGIALVQVEVLCANCGGHLGHAFDDGPLPSRMRFCVNGLAVAFVADR